MNLETQIADEIRHRLKIEKLKGYTLLELHHKIPYIMLVYNGTKATIHLGINNTNEIWEIILETPYEMSIRTKFSIYTLDLDKIINEIIEWIIFGHDKNIFNFGPTIHINDFKYKNPRRFFSN